MEAEFFGVRRPQMAEELIQTTELKEQVDVKHHRISIFVEVNGKDHEVRFEHSTVTGAEIRAKAGVPASDDLTRLVHGKPTGGNIAPTDRVEIKDGEHFLAAPGGVVS
jgi:Multiubiquitin